MKLTVNGVERSFEAPPLTPLLHVLRVRTGGHVAFPRVRWTSGLEKTRLEDHVMAWFDTR